jgi:hypothetical protein
VLDPALRLLDVLVAPSAQVAAAREDLDLEVLPEQLRDRS